jgi:hypothetical protein
VGKFLTKAEIYKQFKAEWVALANPETDPQLQVLGGTLLCHSKDRDEVYRKLVELKPRRSAVVFTGKIPKGTAVIL